jgi:hypothetical protein
MGSVVCSTGAGAAATLTGCFLQSGHSSLFVTVNDTGVVLWHGSADDANGSMYGMYISFGCIHMYAKIWMPSTYTCTYI